jgi:hypothetical protein
MGFEFYGERSPEIAGLAASERRKKYLAAVLRSYLHLKTWIGLALFIALLSQAQTGAGAIYFILDKHLFLEQPTMDILRGINYFAAFCCLTEFQISAIRDELKKQPKA